MTCIGRSSVAFSSRYTSRFSIGCKVLSGPLTSNDLRLVALIKMNLTSTDMATFLGVSQDSLRVMRHRLRKKLNLPQGDNLSAYIQSVYGTQCEPGYEYRFRQNHPDIPRPHGCQCYPADFGVTIERNSNGDGQYAILRGMDKRYNYTLVNGVKIPSPDNKYRYVPLDIFPSDLLDRLEVYKTLTPAMEGDAIGGAVNMVMKDAPDRFTLSANISSGYNELFLQRNFMSFDHREHPV
jgi:hypothetical protein